MIVPRGLGASGSLVTSISDAITRMEDVNPAYHNPGGLIDAPGCTVRPGQIAICPDDATGRAGLERQVAIDIDRGWTLNELINSWAPQCRLPICKGNNPTQYSANVSTWTGLPQDVPLISLNTDASIAEDAGGDDSDSDGSAGDSSGWYWAAAIGGALILALAME